MYVLIHLKLPGGADQFFQVFNTGKAALTFLLAVVLNQPAGLDDDIHGLIQAFVTDRLRHLFNKTQKPAQCGHGPGRHQLVGHEFAGSPP